VYQTLKIYGDLAIGVRVQDSTPMVIIQPVKKKVAALCKFILKDTQTNTATLP